MDLPRGWVEVSLHSFFSVIGGGTPSTTIDSYWGESGIPWFSSADIDDNGDISIRRYVTEHGLANSTANIAPKGSIVVVTRVGLGKVAFLRTEMCFSQDNQALIPLFPSLLNNRYVYYCMFNAMQTIKYSGRGTTISGITKKQLTHYSFPLPPLAEQNRIVAKIDALFSELDKGVETLQTIRQQLRMYRQAVLKWAFEGNYINIDITDVRKLEDLCFFITKGTTPAKMEMTSNKGEIPFIKVYNLSFDGTLDFSIDPTFVNNETHNGFLARSKVYPSDVLMNIVGPPLGKVSIVPEKYAEWNINQAIARFRCNNELNNKYLSYYLLSQKTIETISKKSKATAGQFNLTLEICRNIEIPYCSLSEQERIVAEIESRLSVCDKLEQIVDENLNKAQALKQSILKKAFAGQLVLQDPSDEPADKLLERIKAERKEDPNENRNRKRKAGV